jgi:hypothetical protein
MALACVHGPGLRGPGLRKIGEFGWSVLARICSELAPIGLVPMEPKMVG